MDTTIINSNQEEELFAQAEQDWDLASIYEEIEAAKQELFGEKQLTDLQKTILRGLLCNYSPEQISTLLPQGMHQPLVNITWNLHKCVKHIVGISTNSVESYRDIPRWLAIAGFKQQPGFTPPTVSQTPAPQAPAPQPRPIPDNDRPTIVLPPKDRGDRPNNNVNLNQQPVSAEVKSSSPAPPENQAVPQPATNPSSQLQHAPASQQNIQLSVASNSEINRSEISQIEPNYTSSQLSLIRDQHQIVPAEGSLPMVDENDFMPPVSRWTKLGGLFLAGSVGVAIVLSAFTPYSVNVKAQGTLRPAAGLKIVEATTEGKVNEIRVKENQVVQKGDVIAVLDRSSLDTRSGQLEISIDQADLQLKQIEAQIKAQANRLLAEQDSTQRKIAAARSQLSLRRREYQDRQSSSSAQVSEAQADLGSAQEELAQAQTELISAEANLKSAQAALNSALSRKERYEDIAASGAISRDLLDEAILNVEQRQQDIIVQESTINRQKQEISRRQRAIAAAQARLDNARVATNPNSGEIDIATENIAQEEAAGRANLARLKQEQEGLIQQRIEIEKKLERDEKELAQLRKDSEQTAIAASADGIVFQLQLRNPGQTVASGQEIARIAPSNTALSIEALIPSQEIGKVEPGQTTHTRISACPYPDYGTLSGVVTEVAPDATSPQGGDSPNPGGGSTFYKVTISPESLTFGNRENKCTLQPGMQGQTDITTKSDTVLKFMLRKAKLLTNL